jgi:hypothetical protein
MRDEIDFQASMASAVETGAADLKALEDSSCSLSRKNFLQAEQCSTCAETTLAKDASSLASANLLSNSEDG